MPDDVYSEFDQFLFSIHRLPPEDQRFVTRLIAELSRRSGAGADESADEAILEATRDIAPERVGWVASRLAA